MSAVISSIACCLCNYFAPSELGLEAHIDHHHSEIFNKTAQNSLPSAAVEIKVEETFEENNCQTASTTNASSFETDSKPIISDAILSTPEALESESLTAKANPLLQVKPNVKKRKSKRLRVFLSENQKHILQTFYSETKFPDGNQRIKIGKLTGLDVTQVRFWFENRRKTRNVAAVQPKLQVTAEHLEGLTVTPAQPGDTSGKEDTITRPKRSQSKIVSIAPEDLKQEQPELSQNVPNSSKRRRKNSSSSLYVPEECLEEDSDTNEGRKIAKRTTRRKFKFYTDEQKIALMELYRETNYPDPAIRNEVCSATGLSPRQVQIWFQNMRRKERRSGDYKEKPVQQYISEKENASLRSDTTTNDPVEIKDTIEGSDVKTSAGEIEDDLLIDFQHQAERLRKSLASSLTRIDKNLAPRIDNEVMRSPLKKNSQNLLDKDNRESAVLREQIAELERKHVKLMSKNKDLELKLSKVDERSNSDLKSLLSDITTLETEVTNLNKLNRKDAKSIVEANETIKSMSDRLMAKSAELSQAKLSHERSLLELNKMKSNAHNDSGIRSQAAHFRQVSKTLKLVLENDSKFCKVKTEEELSDIDVLEYVNSILLEFKDVKQRHFIDVQNCIAKLESSHAKKDKYKKSTQKLVVQNEELKKNCEEKETLLAEKNMSFKTLKKQLNGKIKVRQEKDLKKMKCLEKVRQQKDLKKLQKQIAEKEKKVNGMLVNQKNLEKQIETQNKEIKSLQQTIEKKEIEAKVQKSVKNKLPNFNTEAAQKELATKNKIIEGLIFKNGLLNNEKKEFEARLKNLEGQNDIISSKDQLILVLQRHNFIMDEKLAIQSNNLQVNKSSMAELSKSTNKYVATIKELEDQLHQKEVELLAKLKEHSTSLSLMKTLTEKSLKKKEKMVKIHHRLKSSTVLINLLQKQLKKKCVRLTELENLISKRKTDEILKSTKMKKEN